MSDLGNGTAIVANSSGQKPISAIWNGSDLSSNYTGKIITLFDVNLMTDSYIRRNDNLKFLENLVAFATTISSPTIESSSLSSDNSYIDVTISEAVYNTDGGSGALEASDFSLAFDNGVKYFPSTGVTISSIKKNDNTSEGSATALSGGETVVRVFLSIAGTPNGGETVTITPIDGASIYALSGRPMELSETTGAITLNDQLKPIITGVVLSADNTTLAVTMSEAVFNTNGGSGALQASDFSFTINGGVATLSSVTPTSISANGTVYTLGIGLSGTPNGNEVLSVNPVDNGIYDLTGNESAIFQTNNSAFLNDNINPIITSVSLASNNTTLAVTMSEAVYNTDGGSGALEAADFVFSISLGCLLYTSDAADE